MPLPNQEHGYKILAIGSDTEVFLKDKVTGQSVPVVGLLGGTKQNPRPVIGKGFSVQEDNVMAEFNIPPSNSKDHFASYIEMIKTHLADHFAPKGLELDISPSAMFERHQLASPQAHHIGCESDICVWSLEESDLDASNPLLRRMRTAGGHLHVSFTKDGRKPELQEIFPLVKAWDVFLGVPSILLDLDTRRRQLYGKAGAFRIKEYAPNIIGAEYRTLSNFWIRTPELSKWVFGQLHAAVQYVNNWHDAEDIFDMRRQQIEEIINTANAEEAFRFVLNWGSRMPTSLWPEIVNRFENKSKGIKRPKNAYVTLDNIAMQPISLNWNTAPAPAPGFIQQYSENEENDGHS